MAFTTTKFYNEKESCQSLGGTFIGAKFHKTYMLVLLTVITAPFDSEPHLK